MKFPILCFLFSCFVVGLHAQNFDLDLIRKDFKKGVKDADLCDNYYKLLKTHAKTEVEKGYQGAFQIFMAKHTGNPLKKMSYFNGGKRVLESQITLAPNNIELRFIRLCIQFYAPSYLGYSSSVNSDKEYLKNNLYKVEDKALKSLLYEYLKGAKMYSENELELLGR